MVQALKRRMPTSMQRREPPRERDGKTSYGHRRWRRESEQWLRLYPFCVLCMCHGRINQGAESNPIDVQRNLVVDHITPHKGDQSLFWDVENRETLCRMPCHDSTKSHVERTGKDWFVMLRGIIKEKRTQEFIEQHRDWIPEHVYARLVGTDGEGYSSLKLGE